MKLAAHPLVVAVALGVLPAHALAEDRDEEEPVSPCTTCGGAEERVDDDPAIEALLDALRDLPGHEG